jgi:hypothetical protein
MSSLYAQVTMFAVNSPVRAMRNLFYKLMLIVAMLIAGKGTTARP